MENPNFVPEDADVLPLINGDVSRSDVVLLGMAPRSTDAHDHDDERSLEGGMNGSTTSISSGASGHCHDDWAAQETIANLAGASPCKLNWNQEK
uniref:Uncharacterized protein n=1 Tax=Pristionchus pacificus TaxID=54126 RepID=A0A2A6C9I8_PRIPA|eukprot:PDM74766.1 hypothetical protein PRIPAC_43717 [Pristionchus pacificus]